MIFLVLYHKQRTTYKSCLINAWIRIKFAFLPRWKRKKSTNVQIFGFLLVLVLYGKSNIIINYILILISY